MDGSAAAARGWWRGGGEGCMNDCVKACYFFCVVACVHLVLIRFRRGHNAGGDRENEKNRSPLTPFLLFFHFSPTHPSAKNTHKHKMSDPLPPTYVKPPKTLALSEQEEDDPLDARTMPHASRSGPPSANKHKGPEEHELASRRGHPAKHSHESDRKSGWVSGGRHLPPVDKKKANKKRGARAGSAPSATVKRRPSTSRTPSWCWTRATPTPRNEVEGERESAPPHVFFFANKERTRRRLTPFYRLSFPAPSQRALLPSPSPPPTPAPTMAPISFSSTGSLLLKDIDSELSPAGGVDAGAVLTAKTVRWFCQGDAGGVRACEVVPTGAREGGRGETARPDARPSVFSLTHRLTHPPLHRRSTKSPTPWPRPKPPSKTRAR